MSSTRVFPQQMRRIPVEPACGILALLGVCATVAAGCGRSSEEGDDGPIAARAVDPDVLRRELVTDEEIARLTDRSLDAYERATVALEQAGDDCEAAARALRAIVRVDGAAIARAKLLSELPDLLARARPILEARAERTRDLTARMGAATSRCAAHPAVAGMLQHF